MLISLRRISALMAKEFKQLLRDPKMRFFVVIPPILQMIVFGFAATFDVNDADVAVVDRAGSSLTRDLIAAMGATDRFHPQSFDALGLAAVALDGGSVRAIVQFPPDFETSRQVHIVVDGSDANSAQMILGELINIFSQSVSRGMTPPLTVQERAWYNPNLSDRWFFIPGIIANVVTIATLLLTAMTVVRERELGTLERLQVTPISGLELIVAKLVPVAAVGLFDVGLVTWIGIEGFGVPFRGQPLALLIGSVLFLVSTLGLGLLISSYSQTQQQAMISAVFIVMPLVIFSGFAFPIRNMPDWIQALSLLDPLRYFLVVIRDVFLKGGDIVHLLPEFGAMALLGVVAMGISAWRMR